MYVLAYNSSEIFIFIERVRDKKDKRDKTLLNGQQCCIYAISTLWLDCNANVTIVRQKGQNPW